MRRYLIEILASGVLACLCSIGTSLASPAIIYDSIPSPLPPNVVSEGYECCTRGQVGDEIGFSAGSSRQLHTAIVTMSDWATHSAYLGFGDATGFTVPMTLTLYNVGSGGSVGSAIASSSITANILWRPESGGCADTTAYLASDGGCYHGLAQNVSFNFGSQTVPDHVIFGLAFNTETYGADPIGTHGPYDSLNLGLNTATSIGTDTDPNVMYYDGAYNRGGCGTGATFEAGCGLSPYTPAIEFAAVPEPASMTLLGMGVLGIAAWRRRRRS